MRSSGFCASHHVISLLADRAGHFAAGGFNRAALGIGRHIIAHRQHAAGFHHGNAEDVHRQGVAAVGIVGRYAVHFLIGGRLLAAVADKAVGHHLAGGFDGGGQHHLFGWFGHFTLLVGLPEALAFQAAL